MPNEYSILFSGSEEFTCVVPSDYSTSATTRDFLSGHQHSILNQYADLVLYSINYEEFGIYDNGYEVTKVFTMDAHIEYIIEYNIDDLAIRFGEKAKGHNSYTASNESWNVIAWTGNTVQDILVTYSGVFWRCSVKINGAVLDSTGMLLSDFVNQDKAVNIIISECIS
ncbi:hypothetical protein BX667DRAFT_519835 [Coemansia mojavensis]|nr:hypothetical protein BX667DRAFT_519835 [Coemansia mojavensis]